MKCISCALRIICSKLETFGDFPIIKNTLPDESESLIQASKRAPRYKVAHFILEDLDQAISLLTNNISGGKNRITKKCCSVIEIQSSSV